MKINDRLKEIASLIDQDAKIIDIGCDHALLDIYLVQENKIKKAIASDIASGPLAVAQKNIKKYNLEDKINTRLGNGLETYTDDIDTIVISGLGGKTMKGIFLRNMKVLKKVSTIVISPNNYQEDIKRFLCKNGFYIENEQLVKEKNIIYQIIKLKRGKVKYSNNEYYFGPILIKKETILFKEFYEKEQKSKEILLMLIPKKFYLKRIKLKREIKRIKKQLESA